MRVKDVVDGEPKYELIAGRRRVAAITMHNLAASDKDQLTVKAVVVDPIKAQSMFRRAAHENILRENISPIDFAFNIQTLRKRGKLEGQKGTKKVAEFFRVSPATVTQHEKLLKLSDEIQKAIHEGVISRDAAFVLVSQPVDKQQEILDVAIGKQRGEVEVEAAASAEAEVNAPKPKKAGKRSGAAGKGGVKAKHVRAAAREVTGTTTKRSRGEILEFFAGMIGPAYGYPDGAVHQFCNNFEKWAKGEIQDRTLDKYWAAMVERSPKGTAASVKVEEKAARKPRVKK